MSALILNSTWTISAVRNVDEWVLSTSGDRAIRVDLKITEFVDSWCNLLQQSIVTTPAWKCVENAAPPRTHIPKMACIWVALPPSLVHRPRTVADFIGHLDVSKLGHSDDFDQIMTRSFRYLDETLVISYYAYIVFINVYYIYLYFKNQLFRTKGYRCMLHWLPWTSTGRSASTGFTKVWEHPCVGFGEKDSRHTWFFSWKKTWSTWNEEIKTMRISELTDLVNTLLKCISRSCTGSTLKGIGGTMGATDMGDMPSVYISQARTLPSHLNRISTRCDRCSIQFHTILKMFIVFIMFSGFSAWSSQSINNQSRNSICSYLANQTW